MPARATLAREALAGLKIRDPEDLAKWARKRGLLGAYLLYTPARAALPSCWQVIRPGHQTDPEGPAWQRGHKTFRVHSGPDKGRGEQAARTWATAHLGCSGWVRIEGLGGALFPAAVAEELARDIPDLVTYRQRQHTR